MNNTERFEYLNTPFFRETIQMVLLDWAGYWTTSGLEPITDLLQKEQTRVAINMILVDGGSMVQKVSRLAISADVFKQKSADEITDADIKLVNDGIMASKLEWLTGVRSLPPEAEA